MELLRTQLKDYYKRIEHILNIRKNLFSPMNVEWLFLFQKDKSN